MSKKRIIIAIIVLGIVLITTVAVAIGIYMNDRTKTTDTPSTNTDSGQVAIPETIDARNTAAKQALDAAMVALNSGDKTEAKKQLDDAKTLYTSARNQEGVDAVDAQYPVLENIPDTSPTPVTGSSPN